MLYRLLSVGGVWLYCVLISNDLSPLGDEWVSSLSSFTLPQSLSPMQNCLCSAENVLHFFFHAYLKLHFIVFTGILTLINNNRMFLGGFRHLNA